MVSWVHLRRLPVPAQRLPEVPLENEDLAHDHVRLVQMQVDSWFRRWRVMDVDDQDLAPPEF